MGVLALVNKRIAQHLLPDADEVFVVLRIGRIDVGLDDTTQDFDSFRRTDIDVFTKMLQYIRNRNTIKCFCKRLKFKSLFIII